MRRVLVVAYYFPPLGGMGSLRVAGFVRHLPEHGWDPVVVAPRHGAYHHDPDLEGPGARVIRTASFEISRTAKRILRAGGDDVAPARVSGVRAGLRRAARTALYHPDSQIGWLAPALRAARREVRERPVDAVVSSSFPVTAHLVARRLAREGAVPWVADWRDPWAEMLPVRTLASRRATSLEQSLARAAAVRVMTSPSWARHHADLWQQPVSTIPNGHEDEKPVTQPPADFVLTYMGSFYPDTQSVSGVWPAIRRLEERGHTRVDRIRFIGDLHPALRAELDAQDLGDRTDVTGFLGHSAAMKCLRESSVLLVAGPRDATGLMRGQVAGKIPEYLATGLPIVYSGDLDCDAAHLLRAHAGCHLARPHDVDALAEGLAASHGAVHDRDVSGLSRRALAGVLAGLLDEVAR
jgi:glycosyltransferase involved in cell wall biosynthesis